MSNLYSHETERALLGLVLKNEKYGQHIFGSIRAEEFDDEANTIMFMAMEKCFEAHGKIDIKLMLPYFVDYKGKTSSEWIDYAANLTYEAGIETNISEYISVIKDRYQARKLAATLDESQNLVNMKQMPVQDLIEEIETKIFDVTRERELRDFKHVNEITTEYFDKMHNFEHEIEDSLVKTGISSLDQLLGGFHPGDFVILAARPSVGKTAVALEFVRNISLTKHVGFFSIEMPSEQIILRMLSSISLLDGKKIKLPSKLNDRQKTQLEIAINELKKCNIHIDDSPSLKLTELTWKARKLKSLGKLDFLVIDYIQIINSSSFGRSAENRNFVMSEISRTLKQLARELQIPIVALSQLSRQTERREHKRPLLSDIRDSGAIEQDADVIMFLYRESLVEKPIVPSEIDTLEIIVAKHRNGPTGTVFVNFNMALGKITIKKETKDEVSFYN